MPEHERLPHVISQIEFAREYTKKLLDTIPTSEWFRQPQEGVTHIAWQVGHLAMAEYRLVLERLRPRSPEDEQLISDEFLSLFGKGSVPDPDPSLYPSLEVIREVFDAVHKQAMREADTWTEENLSEAPLKPHMLFSTKFGALVWCAQHEMSHAGQIGLIRRLLGQPPIW